jgi:hypothetical protein
LQEDAAAEFVPLATNRQAAGTSALVQNGERCTNRSAGFCLQKFVCRPNVSLPTICDELARWWGCTNSAGSAPSV